MGLDGERHDGPPEAVREGLEPLLFHTHGIGGVDFSAMEPADLQTVEELAEERRVCLVPTIFLRRPYLDQFRRVLREYVDGKRRGLYRRIFGFGVEGPLLGSSGGVPTAGCWEPNPSEWAALAELGRCGLSYIVLAPDAADLREELRPGVSFEDVIDAFYSNGVKLALGHFRHDDPDLSAARTNQVIDYIQARFGPSPSIIVTDHLYNDMPRRFVHAWRTFEERAERDQQLEEFLRRPWTVRSLPELLGPVPAALLLAARHGRLTPTLNFDGEHVDLAICQRTVEFLGANRLIAITDDTEGVEMAGEALTRRQGSTLLFREDGKVAAGSGGLLAQTRNMRAIGLSQGEIDELSQANARVVLETGAVVPRGVPRITSRASAGQGSDEHRLVVKGYVEELRKALAEVDPGPLAALVGMVVDVLRGGRTVFVAGNGGSAAAAGHMVSDWTRAAAYGGISPARVVSLSDNSESLTGLANDFGFGKGFEKRLMTGSEPGDLFLALSVSGESSNLINAARAARANGVRVAALAGRSGDLTRVADTAAIMKVSDYGLAEDLQVSVNHMVVRALSDGALPGVCEEPVGALSPASPARASI